MATARFESVTEIMFEMEAAKGREASSWSVQRKALGRKSKKDWFIRKYTAPPTSEKHPSSWNTPSSMLWSYKPWQDRKESKAHLKGPYRTIGLWVT